MYMQGFEPVRPTANDVETAQETSRRLAALLDEEHDVKVKILEKDAL